MAIWIVVPLLAIVAALSFLCGVCAVLWWAVPRIERSYLFRPEKVVVKTPAEVGIPFEQHFIETPDGCRLSAWHMCPSDPLAAVVYFHGNGANLGILIELFDLYYRAGLQVMAVDYRGYGWSSGVPSEEGLCVDAESAVRYFREKLKARHVPLIYWGRSLGSCFAAYAAGKHSPNGLILETAFPSKSALLRHYPQFKPFHVFSRCRLDTLGHLRGHDFPILVVHGDRDKTIPLEQGQDLFNALKGPKAFYRVEGADHINLHRIDSAQYVERVLNFIRQTKPVVN